MISFKQYLNKLVAERYVVLWGREGQKGDYEEALVDDDQFIKALNYLKTDKTSLEDVKKLIIQSGFNEASVKSILHIVYSFNNPTNFFEALKRKMPMSELLNCGNVTTYVAEKYNLDIELVRELLLYQAPTVPVTGKTEAFIMLFVEGATKGTRKKEKKPVNAGELAPKAEIGGDIVIGSEKYEIKGTGARIKANKPGYGSSERAVDVFEKNLRQLMSRAGINEPFTAADLSITSKNYGFADKIAPSLLQSKKVQFKQIVQLHYSWITELYTNDSVSSSLNLTEWITQSLDKNTGQFIRGVFEKNYFNFALKYYAMIDSFNAIVLISTKGGSMGKIASLTRDQITSGDIPNTITYDGLPSLTRKAGMAAFFQIKLPGTAPTAQ